MESWRCQRGDCNGDDDDDDDDDNNNSNDDYVDEVLAQARQPGH